MNAPSRIVSLDQFRGYTVVAMFVVNFVERLAATHQLLRHNNTHFSYADSIMPSFIFICGLSYRMTFVRRLQEHDWRTTARRYVARSLGLLLFSLMLYGFDATIPSWKDSTSDSIWKFVAMLFKARLWQVLAIIGAVQLLILPVIAASARTRLVTVLVFALLHLLLSGWFNYDFVYGRPNFLDEALGTSGNRAWDGGIFGLISWAEIMLAGSLAFDFVTSQPHRRAFGNSLLYGSLLMVLGYSLSCLATLYDVQANSPAEPSVTSPVWPPLEKLAGREWTSILAPPPFVPPPPPSERSYNYWMMDKRVVTQSFVAFSTGLALVLYGLFVVACDAGNVQLGVLRTFGQNPLAAYVVHYLVAHSIHNVVPKDSPVWWVVFGLVVFLAITYAFVRYLEKQSLYLRV